MLTSDQHQLVQKLTLVPGRPGPMPPGEFLGQFGSSDGAELALKMLREAVDDQSAEDVEDSMIVGFTFGFDHGAAEPLGALAFADWHHSHEDVAAALGKLRDRDSVDALLHLAAWVPTYLAFDLSRALARQAVNGLMAIDPKAAAWALSELPMTESTDWVERYRSRLSPREIEQP